MEIKTGLAEAAKKSLAAQPANLGKFGDISPAIIENLILQGDIAGMNSEQRVEYVTKMCGSLGLNPLTKPFQILVLKGKTVLYATKDCTEQLRKVHTVSITDLKFEQIGDILLRCTATAADRYGKLDISTGVLAIAGLKGEDLANAMMKVETKAKRRVTLSICGLGFLDESAVEDMPNVIKTVDIDAELVTDEQNENKAAEDSEKPESIEISETAIKLIEAANSESDLKNIHNMFPQYHGLALFAKMLNTRTKEIRTEQKKKKADEKAEESTQPEGPAKTGLFK